MLDRLDPRVVVVVITLAGTRDAVADREASPMFGIAAVGGDSERSPDRDSPVGGVALDVAWWHGRFGLAAEGSALWTAEDDHARAFVLGGSARVRLLERIVPAVMEPRDVELGLELHAIVDRTWWNDGMSQADPVGYGLGLALRFRGNGDSDPTLLISESRFFLRVMSSRWSEPEVLARTISPMPASERSLTLIFGIGASWGVATPHYMRRFDLQPFRDAAL
jgi:hypothetical protein